MIHNHFPTVHPTLADPGWIESSSRHTAIKYGLGTPPWLQQRGWIVGSPFYWGDSGKFQVFLILLYFCQFWKNTHVFFQNWRIYFCQFWKNTRFYIHFSKIGKNISPIIDPPPATFNDFLIESFPNLRTFPPTSADEIRQIIASLKCKATSNSYDIPAKFLKISASSLSSWFWIF